MIDFAISIIGTDDASARFQHYMREGQKPCRWWGFVSMNPVAPLAACVWCNSAFYAGKLNAKVAPSPSGLFSAQILPPWASTMLFEINSPRPVPLSDFVENFVKSRGIMSGSIPVPLSATPAALESRVLRECSQFDATRIFRLKR
jgi:hypothetical protein